jgi:hypothetical protein
MRTMLVGVVLVVGAAGLAAQEKKYEKDGKFTAKFPSGPLEFPRTAGGLKMQIFYSAFENGKGGYMVAYGDLPPETLRAPKPEQVLESSEKGLVENFKAKVTKSSATTFGPKKYPAREIVAERSADGVEFHLRGTVVLVGTRLYQVYVFGPKDFITSKEADAFLASFTITD